MHCILLSHTYKWTSSHYNINQVFLYNVVMNIAHSVSSKNKFARFEYNKTNAFSAKWRQTVFGPFVVVCDAYIVHALPYKGSLHYSSIRHVCELLTGKEIV